MRRRLLPTESTRECRTQPPGGQHTVARSPGRKSWQRESPGSPPEDSSRDFGCFVARRERIAEGWSRCESQSPANEAALADRADIEWNGTTDHKSRAGYLQQLPPPSARDWRCADPLI